MKALFAALTAFAAATSLAFCQGGPLTPPPGPPAPTMKSLDLIEPRMAINAENTPGTATATFRITGPGSYYLAASLVGEAGKNGIEIASHDVTLDLNGFALTGVPDSLSGILVPAARKNIVIRNGNIRAWGQSGIAAAIEAGRIERITASGNSGFGIDTGLAGALTSHMISCEAVANGLGGIRGGESAIVTDCIARGNQGPGINAEAGGAISRCTVYENQNSGIFAAFGATVTQCNAYLNNGVGIYVSDRSTVSHCTTTRNGVGIIATARTSILHNNCSLEEEDGIRILGFDNRIESNHVTINKAAGISVLQAGNFIVKNSARGNVGGNYVTTGVQTIGPIITATGAIADTVSAWANFSF